MIYLDHNATTPMPPEVLEAVLPFLGDIFANPSSQHRLGEQARAALEDARNRVAQSLGARSAEIVFTSGGTESIHGALTGMTSCGARALVTTRAEHTAAALCADRLEKEGVQVRRLPVDRSGRVEPDVLEEALDAVDAPVALNLIWANNETGVLQDVSTLGALARTRGALVHLDGVQLAGKGMPNLAEIPADMVSLSGHKFGAPKGAGVLWIRRGAPVRPRFAPGHQEGGLRGGTENLPGIVGLARALEVAKERWVENGSRVEALRDALQRRIVEALPGTLVNGADAPRIGNTLNLCFRGIEGSGVVHSLSEEDIHVSSGSACLSDVDGPSPVLAAMGVPLDFIHGSVRYSLSWTTTSEDIDRTVDATIGVVRRLQAMNPSRD